MSSVSSGDSGEESSETGSSDTSGDDSAFPIANREGTKLDYKRDEAQRDKSKLPFVSNAPLPNAVVGTQTVSEQRNKNNAGTFKLPHA